MKTEARRLKKWWNKTKTGLTSTALYSLFSSIRYNGITILGYIERRPHRHRLRQPDAHDGGVLPAANIKPQHPANRRPPPFRRHFLAEQVLPPHERPLAPRIPQARISKSERSLQRSPSTTMGKLQYHRGGTGVFPLKYWHRLTFRLFTSGNKCGTVSCNSFYHKIMFA